MGCQGRSRTLRRRAGLSGTSCSTVSRRAPSCRSSMLLCRRWGTSWWRRSGTSICRSPNRLSKCPKSRLHPVVLAGAGFLWCSRGRNSWWKCLRSYPFLFCTGLWSRTWTFQFLMVVAVGTVGEVFKVYARDRLQRLHLRTHLALRIRLYRGFSHFSPSEKNARLGPHSRSELAAARAHPRGELMACPWRSRRTGRSLEDEGKSTLGLTTAGIPGSSFIR